MSGQVGPCASGLCRCACHLTTGRKAGHVCDLRVIGVDPGPTPGVVVLDLEDGRLVEVGALQCSASLLYTVVATFNPDHQAVVAVERFVVRGRASTAQQTTLDQVANLTRLYPRMAVRSASQVKPWATDARLDAAGLSAATKGMRHARDAARHALYAAVKNGGLPDPLSKEFTR